MGGQWREVQKGSYRDRTLPTARVPSAPLGSGHELGGRRRRERRRRRAYALVQHVLLLTCRVL
jgi:hypothetical protein